MTKRIFSAEVNHESASIQVRKKLQFSRKELISLLTELKKELDEVFIISTADRFAIYGLGEDITPLVNFFSEREDVNPYVHYFTNSENAIHHLLATASGLCSQVKGERHVLLHLKETYQLAYAHQAIGPVFDSLLRQAILAGEKVRKETGIDKFSTSVVDAGFSILASRCGKFHKKKFLVIGTGKIVRLTLQWMHREGIRSVLIASHDPEKAIALAVKYNYIAIDIRDVEKYFCEADIVIGGSNRKIDIPSAESGGDSSCFDMDFTKPVNKVILDFGMPGNFDDFTCENPRVELYNLDDFRIMTDSPLDTMGGMERAWKIVMEQTEEFLTFLRQRDISPVLSACLTHLSNVKNKERELEWLFPRLSNISKEDKELIKKYANELISSISKDPLNNIRRLVNSGDSSGAIEAIKKLYDLQNSILNLSDN